MSTHDQIMELKERMGRSIIGQEQVVERLLLTLLCNGNVLVEGLPGLAKTRAVKALAKNLVQECFDSGIRCMAAAFHKAYESAQSWSGYATGQDVLRYPC